MDEGLKKNLKRMAQDTELRLARSILRWKYKKEGRSVPVESQLEIHSRQVADRAHDVIARTSKNVWGEVKKVYSKDVRKGEGPEE
jgi:hypothetical protein